MPQDSIRIALVALNYGPEPTGIGPFAADLARGLLERGHHVTVIAGHPHYPQWKAMGGSAEYDRASANSGIDVVRKRHSIPSGPSLVARSRMEVGFGLRAAIAANGGADLVLCISPPLLATAAVVARERLRFTRTPIVVWVQDLYGLGIAETKGADSPMSRLALAFESRVFRKATALAVIHDRFKHHIVEALDVDGDKISVFRNWSRQEPITLAERDEVLDRVGWTEWRDHTIVLHAGNIGTKQGLENVVAAGRIADRSLEKIVFVLLGDGNQRARLQRLAAGVKSVRFVDVLDDLTFGFALRAADILLVNQQPAISDMCVPSKLVSYYMAGRPVIAAVDTAGITADEVRNAGAGTVVPAGDPARLLDEVRALAGDTERSARMGRSARAFIEQNFDRDATIDAMSEWLVEIAGRT